MGWFGIHKEESFNIGPGDSGDSHPGPEVGQGPILSAACLSTVPSSWPELGACAALPVPNPWGKAAAERSWAACSVSWH